MGQTFKFLLRSKVQFLNKWQSGVVTARYALRNGEEQPSPWYLVHLETGSNVHVPEDRLVALPGK